MTVTSNLSVILVSDKLVNVNNLTTLVPVKLDIDEMKYSSWLNDEVTSSNPSPLTLEWLKIDFIVLSWIFMTLSKTLQQRLVFKDPQTDKAAWDLIAVIFNENKRTCYIALKAKLHSLKLGELNINAYFCKIESIATILTSLMSLISNDDVITISLEGLPAKYDNISGIIVHREPFPDLKMVRSMLTSYY
ncbi:hybrid signal transduction histidine kinase M [Tanacetum coccineum]